MFTYIKVKNYKSLVDVEFNLIDKRNKKPKKLVLLYGENGSGKSNIAGVFFTLIELLRTMKVREVIQDFLEDPKYDNKFLEFVKKNFNDIESIIKLNKTVGSTENMVLEFGFVIDNDYGNYIVEMNENKIVREVLNFKIEKNRGNYFELTEDNIKLNEKGFSNREYYQETLVNIQKFWGKHSLLSILINEIEDKVFDYVKENLNENLFKVIEFLNEFSCRVKIGNTIERGKVGVTHEILKELQEGKISIDRKKELIEAEEVLNEFYTNIYADIKKVFYRYEIIGEEIEYNLFCKKIIGTELREIDFKLESTGTQHLLDLLPCILAAVRGEVVIIDEFDSGIHDLLMANIVESLVESINGQLILTTHNTMLMESEINPESLYFIVVDHDGRKKILCISDYEERVYPTTNIRKKYLRGMYNAIPSMMQVDFEELLDILD